MLNLTPPNGEGGKQGELERGTNNGKSIKGISEILNRPIISDKKNHKEKENKNNNKVLKKMLCYFYFLKVCNECLTLYAYVLYLFMF